MEGSEYILAILIVLNSCLLFCLASFVTKTEQFQKDLLKKLSTIEGHLTRITIGRVDVRVEQDVDDDVALVRGGRHAPVNSNEIADKVSDVLTEALGIKLDLSSMIGAVANQMEQMQKEPAIKSVERQLSEIDDK